MSFLRYKTIIEEGDLVIAHLSRENMTPLIVDSQKTYNNKFGTFRHKDMIGKEYGTKMPSHNGRGFMYLLHPTPELWTHVVPHRTQILYVADISYIITYIDLKPGSLVLESGTGSGSFSHSLVRSIAPNGHLYTFEFHEERAKAVKKDFGEHGLSDLITVECRDVCKDGFGIKDIVHADLPAPWEAIPAAKETFKQNRIGKICCFSPCIEQVQRTCASLNENGFVEIKMYECLMREHDVKTIPVYTVADAVNKIKVQQEKKRKRKDQNEQDDDNSSKSKQDPPNLYVTKTPNEAKGHTSYLTFATFLPVLDDD
ncbi:tRNA (adenine(58)-N(1))-methyltransferase catalytic subunit TRMT61A-like [Rhizophagus clarus]|uniref:tRNA (adenine(58)-N(1))-methyltransferase catalytic subunit TRM61 n=1 Tax=Rhizophagus clarus TaxID=94130 RepID=A0A8H3KXM2_9GLOM|nr:tRNA (adenine(58)-N(1))-methyltransferase catalytic subunit TRMT61A-like [Rhizophagus clarus]